MLFKSSKKNQARVNKAAEYINAATVAAGRFSDPTTPPLVKSDGIEDAIIIEEHVPVRRTRTRAENTSQENINVATNPAYKAGRQGLKELLEQFPDKEDEILKALDSLRDAFIIEKNIKN